MLHPPTSQVLRKQMRMAQRVTEQFSTAVVEVLTVDEHHHPRRGVGGKGVDDGIAHERESPGHPFREAGARKQQLW